MVDHCNSMFSNLEIISSENGEIHHPEQLSWACLGLLDQYHVRPVFLPTCRPIACLLWLVISSSGYYSSRTKHTSTYINFIHRFNEQRSNKLIFFSSNIFFQIIKLSVHVSPLSLVHIWFPNNPFGIDYATALNLQYLFTRLPFAYNRKLSLLLFMNDMAAVNTICIIKLQFHCIVGYHYYCYCFFCRYRISREHSKHLSHARSIKIIN